MLTDRYAPDWCETCGIHLALPSYRYVMLLQREIRMPLRCPICVDVKERGR